MGGDDRTRFPPGQKPVVHRRPADPRQEVPVAAAPPPRRPYVREDDSTEPPQPPVPPKAQPIESFSSGEARDRLVENGKFGELFVLFIINLLLGIVTLGIYRFWGKTRIRTYVWSRLSFRGDPFEYSGTGLELFLGFLFALVIFGPLYVGLTVWLYFNQPPEDPRHPENAARAGLYLLGVFGLAIVAFFFIHVATFAAYRYRLSRTVWRGIRGSVSGSAWTYGLLGFGLSLLNVFALGWTKPWADTLLLNYRLKATTIGSVRATCDVKPKPLYGTFSIAWVITFFATILATGGLVALTFGFKDDLRRGRPPGEYILLAVLLSLAIPAVWLVTINFYRALLLKTVAAAARLGGLSFRFEVGGWRLLGFNVANFFIVLLTLGLLLPLVILRYARFIAEHLRVEGDIDYSQMRQSDDKGPRYGEGIAEFFGMGVI